MHIGFTMIDNARIEQAHEVGPSAFLAYCAIVRHANDDRKAWPGIDRLASMTGLSTRWVKHEIGVLEASGWLVVERSKGHVNTYVLPPAESKEPQFPTTKVSSEAQFTQVVNSSSPGSEAQFTQVVNSSSPEVDLRTIPIKKTNRTRPKRDCAVAVVFPSELSSDLFKKAWGRWTAHRKEIKKTLTPSTTKAQLKKLAAWGEARAIAAIDQSIEAGWTGIFETNVGAKNGKRSFPLGPGQRHASATAKNPGEF